MCLWSRPVRSWLRAALVSREKAGEPGRGRRPEGEAGPSAWDLPSWTARESEIIAIVGIDDNDESESKKWGSDAGAPLAYRPIFLHAQAAELLSAPDMRCLKHEDKKQLTRLRELLPFSQSVYCRQPGGENEEIKQPLAVGVGPGVARHHCFCVSIGDIDQGCGS